MKQEAKLKFQFKCPIPLYEAMKAEADRQEQSTTHIMREALKQAHGSGNVRAEKTVYGTGFKACLLPVVRNEFYDQVLNSCGHGNRKGVMVHALRMYLGVKA
jgi:hypothetical protein